VPDLSDLPVDSSGAIQLEGMAMTKKSVRYSRRSFALAVALIGVAGLGTASAAQLSVNDTDVVAGVDAIVDCDADGVALTYVPTYQPGPPSAYVISSITVGDLNDAGSTCSGTIDVTVLDASGLPLATGSVALPSLPATAVSVPLSTSIDVSSIFGVAVAIS
jgi:hypothetical protein